MNVWTRSSKPQRATAAVAAVIVTVALVVVTFSWTRPEPLVLKAVFNDTTGLYVGNNVETLGVRIGEVTRVTPRGTTVLVEMEFPPGTEIARTAGAAIMQSSLVTDRFVELTPAHSDGPVMSSGTTIPLARNRNPANIDEMSRSLDQLVQALNAPLGRGRDIGQLLERSAGLLDGRGAKIRDALIAGQGALSVVDRNRPDLVRITKNLNSLVVALAERDTLIRRLAGNVTTSTSLLSSQRVALRQMTGDLADLVGTVDRFVRANRTRLRSTLARGNEVLKILDGRTAQMRETLDLLPLVAQNISRTYDPETRRLRIRVDMRNTGPFSGVARNQFCEALNLPNCHELTNSDGTGVLDPFFDTVPEMAPNGVPGVTE